MTETQKAPLIYQAISEIMAEVPSIAKDRKNKDQGYDFRGIDDVYAAINPVLAKHGVFMRAEVLDVKREERPSRSGGVLAFVQVRVRYSFNAADGSSVSTESIGEGMDSGDKATPKAMSVAQKYAILQMFAIPTSDPKDPEPDNPDPAPKSKPVPAPAAKPTAKAPEASPVVYPDEFNSSPATAEQLAAIQTGIVALHTLKILDPVIWKGIAARVKKMHGTDVVDTSGLSNLEAKTIAEYLEEWITHLAAAKATAAKKGAGKS